MPTIRQRLEFKESDPHNISTRSNALTDHDRVMSHANSQMPPTHSPRISSGWLLSLQRTIGNQAVQRILAKRGMLSLQSRRANVIQRWWDEYTIEFGERLADNKRIKIFDDRIDHILERHGPDVQEDSPDFYTFTTRKKNVIKKFVQSALASGTVFKGVGGAFDFEYEFDHPVGKNNEDKETSRIRVIVVELGKSGKLGKVQTAYPIP